jgi:hypothetical protein
MEQGTSGRIRALWDAVTKGTAMDEFARLMSMEGVHPLDRPKEQSRPARQARPVAAPEIVAASAPAAGGHAWVTGPRARTALETALDRLATEIRNGRRGWATGIRQDGTTVTLPAASGAAALLGTADRQSLRLMIVGGDGWTFVMHPLMGVATLDEDPATSE